MIRLFIGYDQRETVAYHVLTHSVQARASAPVMVAPLMLSQLEKDFTRERNALQTTDFAFSRFLVPSLCDYEGWAIFMDCDMLVLDDIENLWKLRDDRYAVMCVKHDYKPKTSEKFLGQAQTQYEKKNWSSVMLFNNAKCKALTPDYVNTATGLELHRFRWLENESLIGEVPKRWNYLVGEYDAISPEKISNLHYTLGGPYFTPYKNCDYADLWFAERDAMTHADPDRRIQPASAQMGKQEPAKETASQIFKKALEAIDAGNADEAEALALKTIELEANHADALNMLAVIRHQQLRIPEAIQFLEKAVAQTPGNADFHYNLATLYRTSADTARYKQSLDRVLAIAPAYVRALDERLRLANADGEFGVAEKVLLQLKQIHPDVPQLLWLLIVMLIKQGKEADALPHYERMLEIDANRDGHFMAGYGMSLLKAGQVEKAVKAFETAIARGYADAQTWFNLGIAYDYSANHKQAMSALDKALALEPTHPLAQVAKVLLTLKVSDLKEGRKEYRKRSLIEADKDRKRLAAEWHGEKLKGKKLLTFAEQGIGDAIMFAGFLPYLEKETAKCVVEMYPSLLPLMARSFPNLKMVPLAQVPDAKLLGTDYDYHCGMASLLESLLEDYEPRQVKGYLKADATRRDHLRKKYEKAAPGKKIIGISWHTINADSGPIRNIALEQWKPIFEVEGYRFVSLQYMDHREEVDALKRDHGISILIDEEIDPVQDKDGFASQIAAMDAVVSIQNSTVHLAGALGVPCMLMLSASGDWRWGLSSNQSVWYESVEIFRQPRLGDWQSVIGKIAGQLKSGLKRAA